MAGRGSPEIRVRVADDLDKWIEQQAKANCRSKTAEIEFRLKTAMAAEQSRLDGGDTAAGQASQA